MYRMSNDAMPSKYARMNELHFAVAAASSVGEDSVVQSWPRITRKIETKLEKA